MSVQHQRSSTCAPSMSLPLDYFVLQNHYQPIPNPIVRGIPDPLSTFHFLSFCSVFSVQASWCDADKGDTTARLAKEAEALEAEAREKAEKEAEDARLAKEAEDARLAKEAEDARLAKEAEDARLAKEQAAKEEAERVAKEKKRKAEEAAAESAKRAALKAQQDAGECFLWFS